MSGCGGLGGSGPRCAPGDPVRCLLRMRLFWGSGPKGRSFLGEVLFLPVSQEETQLYVCVSNLCFAEVTSPNTLLAKASQMAQPRVKRSECALPFMGGVWS